MPAPWTQRFDFYLASGADRPTTVFLDLAAEEHAPLRSHPRSLRVRAPMKHPDEIGLRSREEFDAMIALEEELVPAVDAHGSAIYWGRRISAGVTDYFFYLTDEEDRADLDARVATVSEQTGYPLQVGTRPDPR